MTYNREPKFDFAVSFAGEDRELVAEVVEKLQAYGAKIFYDADDEQQVAMWGDDGPEYLDRVYRLQSRFTLMFVSRHYGEKMWPRHERRSALARALEQPTPYVLPVRLDDTQLDGLRPTTFYLDARRLGVHGIVKVARAKLAGTESTVVQPNLERVPRTELERQELLAHRPPGWEYLLFAAELLRLKAVVESAYPDYRMGYAPFAGSLDTEGFLHFVDKASQEALHILANAQIMSRETQDLAFGRPGEPGDAEMIAQLVERWNDVYGALLGWTSKVRGMQVPEDCQPTMKALACYTERSVANYRSHVNEIVETMDRVPSAIANGESMSITFEWTLTVDEDVIEEFDRSLAAFHSVNG